MQIKEFEAFTLKDCLQQVRKDLGPDAVILETRKFRKGGVMGWGARDAVCIVAATGITVQSDNPLPRRDRAPQRKPKDGDRRESEHADSDRVPEPTMSSSSTSSRRATISAAAHSDPSEMEDCQPARSATAQSLSTAAQSPAVAAARNAYARMGGAQSTSSATTSTATAPKPRKSSLPVNAERDDEAERYAPVASVNRNAPDQDRPAQQSAGRQALEARFHAHAAASTDSVEVVGARSGLRLETACEDRPRSASRSSAVVGTNLLNSPSVSSGFGSGSTSADADRFQYLERAMEEIRESLIALHRDQREGYERTVSAVVTAVAPAVAASVGAESFEQTLHPVLAHLYRRLIANGVSEPLVVELIDELPDLDAWSETARGPLADAALRDLISRRIASGGAISMIPGQLKAVALIGPTGVGKTTTIAKLAAHYALVEQKKVALLTVDTYRIAAVEQLKTYGQIIDIPIGVAYSHAEVLPAVAQFADYDLLLIDTAGRSQKNIMQVGELKSLLETLRCETHLVLSASTKEEDMVEAASRFSAARVDRLIFSKLDETCAYGTLLNVADRTGIPLSYLTTGQKVPEDIELGDGGRLADLLLN